MILNTMILMMRTVEFTFGFQGSDVIKGELEFCTISTYSILDKWLSYSLLVTWIFNTDMPVVFYHLDERVGLCT